MKVNINNVTGAIVLTPDNEPDKQLLYHLMNCSDLNRFNEYLDMYQRVHSTKITITSDIGVSADQLTFYPVACLSESQH